MKPLRATIRATRVYQPSQPLPRKDEALLVGRDSLLVLDLCLDILYRVAALAIQGDYLACTRGCGCSTQALAQPCG